MNKEQEQKIHDIPLSYARTLSWLSLVIILLTSLSLSFVISNMARATLLNKEESFAKVLAENLNHQIYRRFTVPTILAYGRIALRQTVQYERIESIITSVIHGLDVKNLRIYDINKLVAYSTNSADLGKDDLAPPEVEIALKGIGPNFEIISNIPIWQAPFLMPLKPGTFVLRTLTPLRSDSTQDSDSSIPVMGVLEITQDITDDYEAVLTFQGLIVIICLLSSAVLFTLLLVLIRRSEYVLAERMEKNRKLEKQLHLNEKLVSMGRVVASIAHEIRNPLGIIRSSAEFLLKRTASEDKSTSRILGAIHDESKRLSKTVNDFLDYARPRQPQCQPVDIDVLLEQVLIFLEGEFHKNKITVEKNIAKDIYVSGDKDLLYRAFYNLLVNAEQAMGENGVLKIGAQHIADNMVEISILDSGHGIDSKILANLLDPFFTTKDDGTGLGLPIVNSIIMSHKGTLFLENSDKGGALVRIHLSAVQT